MDIRKRDFLVAGAALAAGSRVEAVIGQILSCMSGVEKTGAASGVGRSCATEDRMVLRCC